MSKSTLLPQQLPAHPALPQVSPTLWWLFGCYSQWYLRRAFHAVRLARTTAFSLPPDVPLVIFLNHPSWWDPLLCLFLAHCCFPERTHYGPIDAAALARYRLLARLGFFGIEPGSRRSAARFLRLSEALMRQPRSTLWITPAGQFTDPRHRPVYLRPGLGHLARRLRHGVVVPLAVEYPFWEERFPEALLRFGAPLRLEETPLRSAAEWSASLAHALEHTQEALAQDACSRNRSAFDVLLGGRAGVGGVYDLWRAARARLRGETFQRSHGMEEE